MCLGESTTEAAPEPYPQQLEQILNKRMLGMKFSVINKGLSAINTTYIVDHLEDNLNQVRPDMVVVMMGVNDFGEHIPWEYTCLNERPRFYQSFRTYKLIRFLGMHLLAKIKGETNRAPVVSSVIADKALAEAVMSPQKVSQSPGFEFINAGWDYIWKADYAAAEEMFRKAIEHDPVSYDAHVALGWILTRRSVSPDNAIAYRKAIAIDPQNKTAYLELGLAYCQEGKYPEAEAVLKEAFEIHPNDVGVNFRLGWAYKMQGKAAQSVEHFKKVVEAGPSSELAEHPDMGYGKLASLYKEIGQADMAEEYHRKADQFRSSHYTDMTRTNYRKLAQTITSRGIKLVCVQYPVRAVESLKRLVGDGSGVVFVDNEKVFKDALRENNYKDIFTDFFGGDFGHCTAKGNYILAENIANVIVKNFFQ